VHTVRHSRDIPAGHIRCIRNSHTLQACLVRKVNVDDLGALPDTEHLSPDLRTEDGVVELAEVVVLATQTVIMLDGVWLVKHVQVPARAVRASLSRAERKRASGGAGDCVGGEILTSSEGGDDDVGGKALAGVGEEVVVGEGVQSRAWGADCIVLGMQLRQKRLALTYHHQVQEETTKDLRWEHHQGRRTGYLMEDRRDCRTILVEGPHAEGMQQRGQRGVRWSRACCLIE